MLRSNALARLGCCWLLVFAFLSSTTTKCTACEENNPTRLTTHGATGNSLLQSKNVLKGRYPQEWHDEGSEAALNSSLSSAAAASVASVPLVKSERRAHDSLPNHTDNNHGDIVNDLKAYFNAEIRTLRALALALAGHWRLVLVAVGVVTGILVTLQYRYYLDFSSERQFFYVTSKEDKDRSHRVFANVLDYITIDSDGGLDKVHEFRTDALRCFYAFSKVGMIFFNVFMIFDIGITVLSGSAAFYRGDEKAIPPYVKNFIDVTNNRAFITVAHTFIVHLVELSSCVGLVVIVAHHFVMFYILRPSFDKFTFGHQAFDWLHALRTFSALKCFKFVHPEIVIRYFELHMMAPLNYTGCIFRVLHAAFFVTTRSVALFLSVVAFGVKLTFISVRFNLAARACTIEDENCEGRVGRWCAVLSLLVQTAGAVSLERLMLWRLFLVVAGGKDCRVDEDEGVALDVYMARLAQTIWDEHFEKGSLFRYVVLMLTFDDTDFQYLLLNEDEGKKYTRFSRIPSRKQPVNMLPNVG